MLLGLLVAPVLLGLVYALSLRGGLNTYRLVLVGIGLSGVCTAYTNCLFSLADQHSIAVAMRWLVGSVNGADRTGVSALAMGLAVCGDCAARLGRPLGSMSLGDELATGLGTSVPAARVAVLALGAGAAALATSVVGPIGFVSLISGPIAARLVGADRALRARPVRRRGPGARRRRPRPERPSDQPGPDRGPHRAARRALLRLADPSAQTGATS